VRSGGKSKKNGRKGEPRRVRIPFVTCSARSRRKRRNVLAKRGNIKAEAKQCDIPSVKEREEKFLEGEGKTNRHL